MRKAIRMSTLGIAITLAPLSACSEDDVPSGPRTSSTTAPGFKQLHERYLAPTCAAGACHDGERGIAGLSFRDPERAYDLLIDAETTNGPARRDGLRRVVANDLERSLLWWKLSASATDLTMHGYGAQMPLGGDGAPGPQTLAAIRGWIEGGAPYDGLDFEPDTRTIDGGYVPCDATDEAGLRACFEANPDPTRFFRVYTPPMTLQPQSEHIICTYLDVTLEEELYFKSTRGQQMAGGHHSAVFYANSPSGNFEPHECTDAEMTNFLFAAGAGGGGGQDTVLPPGTALRIDAGRQIVIQSHYINSSNEVRVVMDAVDLERTTQAESPNVVDPFAMIDSDFVVPPRSDDYTRVTNCRMDREVDIYLLLGHTHDYGSLFTFELLRNGGETSEMLYHATDGPLLRDNPEIRQFGATPVHLGVGDVLRMTCRWNNTTSHELVWPEEMCVALMYYGPGQGWMTCGDGDEGPSVRSDSDDGCGVPGDPGNSVGVGKYCTTRGRECVGNGAATFCIAGFSSHNYCTVTMCTSDEECGEGATCVTEGPGSACVPDYCGG